jgi:hypothetical protein
MTLAGSVLRVTGMSVRPLGRTDDWGGEPQRRPTIYTYVPVLVHAVFAPLGEDHVE